MAAFAQALAVLIKQFGRKRAFANPCGIGLDNTQHKTGGLGAKARSGRGLTRDRIGRGDIRIGAVIDVQERALSAFKQHPLSGLDRLVEQTPGGLGKGQDLGRNCDQLGQKGLGISLGQVQAAAQCTVMGQKAIDLGGQGFGFG